VFKKKCCKSIYQEGKKTFRSCKRHKTICPVLSESTFFRRYNKNGCSRRRKCVKKTIRGRKVSIKCKWDSVTYCPIVKTLKCFKRKLTGSKCCKSLWKNGKRLSFRCVNHKRRFRTSIISNFVSKKGCHYIRVCRIRRSINGKRHKRCKFTKKRCSFTTKVKNYWKKSVKRKGCFNLYKCKTKLRNKKVLKSKCKKLRTSCPVKKKKTLFLVNKKIWM